MAPRFWTVTIGGHDVSVVAGTREAAEKIAAQRVRRQAQRLDGGPRSQGDSGHRFRAPAR